MKVDLLFAIIALPFCIWFGMMLACPLEAGLIFGTMMLLREVEKWFGGRDGSF